MSKAPGEQQKTDAGAQAQVPAGGAGEQAPDGAGGETAGAAADASTAASTAASAADVVAGLKNDITLRDQKIKELEEQHLRDRADTENYRKRLERDRSDAVQYANQELLKDTLAVLDNFERALQSAPKTDATAQLYDGVTLIEQEWLQMLEKKWGVQRIVAVGKEFDPNIHEAMAIEESADHSAEVVGEEYQKGYYLHGRVLRPARVKVIKPAGETASAAPPAGSN